MAAICIIEISIHALREEGDELPLPDVPFSALFLSTPSARRATFLRLRQSPGVVVISIHALREEGDAKWIADNPDAYKFLSTPSARRATATAFSDLSAYKNFYPRPPRGGRRGNSNIAAETHLISIHALREEGDLREGLALGQLDISIHALREEGDERFTSKARVLMDFYPRPPRGGRL